MKVNESEIQAKRKSYRFREALQPFVGMPLRPSCVVVRLVVASALEPEKAAVRCNDEDVSEDFSPSTNDSCPWPS